MSVTITNLTDHPEQVSMLIDIYAGTIAPGESALLSYDRITDKIIGLRDAGYIAINTLPEYYRKWKYDRNFVKPEPQLETPPETPVEEPVVEEPQVDTAKKKKNK